MHVLAVLRRHGRVCCRMVRLAIRAIQVGGPPRAPKWIHRVQHRNHGEWNAVVTKLSVLTICPATALRGGVALCVVFYTWLHMRIASHRSHVPPEPCHASCCLHEVVSPHGTRADVIRLRVCSHRGMLYRFVLLVLAVHEAEHSMHV